MTVRSISPTWYVLGAAVLLRAAVPLFILLWSHDYSAFYEVYTPQYLKPAQELLARGGFLSDGNPEIYRTPGYPLFLIPGLLVKNVPLVTILLQIVLSCLTVYLVFRIALVAFERIDIAASCASMYAIEPLSILFSSLLMPETLLTFAVCVFLFFLVRHLKWGALTDLIGCAVAAAACAYISPITYFLPVVAAFLLFLRVLKRNVRASWIQVIVFLLVSISLLGLWQVRNKIETGYWGFSTIFDNSLYYVQAASVVAEKEGKPISSVQVEFLHRARGYAELHPELALQLRFVRDRGAEVVLSNPLTYAKIHVQGMIRTLIGLAAHGYIRLLDLLPPAGRVRDDLLLGKGLMETLFDNYRDLPRGVILVTIVLAFLTAFFYVFAALPFFSRDLARNWFAIALLGVALYFLLVTGGPHGYSRYRHPIMPVISIFAGYGLFMSCRGLKAERTRE